MQRLEAWAKGYKQRRNSLPNVLRFAKYVLEREGIEVSYRERDGRINSIEDENKIANLLKTHFGERIKIKGNRHWFDVALYDYKHGWIPVNIKSTTTYTCDNIGNLATIVHSLCDYEIALDDNPQNGTMSKIFIRSIKENRICKNIRKDYYFLVFNKENQEVIINGLKGLTQFTSNNNNLPFQVQWFKNKEYKCQDAIIVVKTVIKTIQKPKPSWNEVFLQEIRRFE